ncbi:hypothetical protein [Azotobacter beijerinckii]|uniref:hypothetical protein n=1 Tax=Azotobacter beijerinckii TaxID=170623 RepID=UPI00295352CB|nr:hypothetical protein [Azotobacter beijerinckii]MDV7212715.1 hypothetical protein [Azotobacter beijerinckii]
MSGKIEARIMEMNDGAYYDVLLDAVPVQGQYISLFSHLDQSSGHQAMHQYEVVDVLHQISDVTDKVERSKVGHHSVTLFVKPSSSRVFNQQ